MNEIEYERTLEDIAIGQQIAANLEAILADNDEENVQGLYRTIYKYTDCGPWLSVVLHDGTSRHCDDLHGIDNGNVRSLIVGSIVEGSDAEATPVRIDLIDYEDPEKAVEAFNHAVDEVNEEACAIFDEMNGEEEEEDLDE